MNPQPPLSLYIHIPWCEKKCPYCDFNSHALRDGIPEQTYTDALLHDIDQELEAITDRPLESIFIGGGTPSLYSSEGIARLMDEIRQRTDCIPGIEVTLEANPGSSEASKFEGFQQAGVNRLSIGVQSFSPGQLGKLGRIHDAGEARRAIQAAARSGVDSFNVDLMFGLPGQQKEEFAEDLESALALKPPHLSCYQLTIEPNTEFHLNPPILPADDDTMEMQGLLQSLLHSAGYSQYEVSAWALPGEECRHNLNYWTFGDYIGIGAGAHGKLTSSDGQVRRYWKQKHPRTYMERASRADRIGGEREISKHELPLEFMMNALRLRGGFPEALFTERTGLPLSRLEPQLATHVETGLLVWQDGHLGPTDKGYRFIDTMLTDYL